MLEVYSGHKASYTRSEEAFAADDSPGQQLKFF
jgi:hypothetical protein